MPTLRRAAGRASSALGRALRQARRRRGAIGARALLREATADGPPPNIVPVHVFLATAYEAAVLEDALAVAGAIRGLDLRVTAVRGVAEARAAAGGIDGPGPDVVALSFPLDGAAGAADRAGEAMIRALAADLAAETGAPVLRLDFGAGPVPIARADAEAPDVTRLHLPEAAAGGAPFDTRFAASFGVMPSTAGADALADAIAAFAARRAGLGPKLIVADLDDTLWAGALGEGEAAGEPGALHRPFAEALADFRDRGLVLAAASRNAPEDVAAALSRLEAAGALPPGFFATLAVGWRDKDALVAEVLDTLGLAAEHTLFLDDDPLNCARVAARFPAMDVRWTEGDSDAAARTLRADPALALEAAAGPAAGPSRAERYRLRAEVDRLRDAEPDPRAFLEALDTHVTLRPLDRETAGRAAELARRVNQMVLTDARPARAALQDRSSPFDFLAEARDIFGDHGQVGLVLARPDPERAGAVRLDNLFLSCRVLQRGIETAMLHALAARAALAGFTALAGRVEALPRNAPARDLLASAGFGRGGADWHLTIEAGPDGGVRPPLPPGITLHDTAWRAPT
ncbi:MAG: HAD-IIIC family phosphatase [Azospirillaceae bacterium]